MDGTPEKITEIIGKYNVDVIEVVGHTDEQPLGARQSNLDRELVSVLKGNTVVGSLTPADNAGLGLARAVSVISVLRQSKLLERYKIIPLSGAQLVDNDETLALTGNPGAVSERRRIEIRLRKSTPQDTNVKIPARPVTAPSSPKQVRPPAPKQSTAPPPIPSPPPTPSLWNIFRQSN